MLFNSYEFIFIFLPISFVVYFYFNHKRLTTASKAWLVFSSLFFYSWWNVAYLPLILISLLVNYTLANTMLEYEANKKKRYDKKFILRFGLIFNVGLLVYFKYMDFFIENTNAVFGSNIELLHLALPLAISFYTLQQIAFLIDSYENLVKERNFLDYAIFVTFFPQLIAGPIVHHKEMMPQFLSVKNKVKNYKNIALGFFIFSIGLFKKVVIADTFAIWANAGFDRIPSLNLIEAWATSLSYTFQIYFDFSGYTDMAIGTALFFNIRLPQNFNSPYKATSIIEFWQKWHMTLTNFIGTYLYTPMLYSFKKMTFIKAMIVTFIAFTVVGLWHGASWMFVLFGMLHGLATIINHIWRKTKVKLNKYISWFITFNFLNFSLVIFRANNWDDAIKVLSGMLNISNLGLSNISTVFFKNYTIICSYLNIFYLIISFFIILKCSNSMEKLNAFKFTNNNLIVIIILLFLSILQFANSSDFLYFNF